MSEMPVSAPATPPFGAGGAEDPHHAEAAKPEAQGLIAFIFALIAAALILLLPALTRPAPIPKGWWMEPATWPLFCLVVVLLAAGWQAAAWIAAGRTEERGRFIRESFDAFGGMRPALEYSVYFCIYLVALGYLGFALSSLLFLQWVTWRAGLRGLPWRLKALGFVILVIIAFRVGIELWFPMAPLYEALFPDWFVQSVAIYL